MASSKKGFQIPQRTATLVFDGDFEGAEVDVLLDVSLGDFVEFMKIDEEATLLTLTEEYDWWVSKGMLRGWNLEDSNGKPVPIGPGCMNSIPRTLAREIMRAWFRAVTEIPGAEQTEEDTSEEVVMEVFEEI